MNKSKGRQHTRYAARRAAAKLKRGQKANAKAIDREKRIKRTELLNPNPFRHSSRYDTPSDFRRATLRQKKFGPVEVTL